MKNVFFLIVFSYLFLLSCKEKSHAEVQVSSNEQIDTLMGKIPRSGNEHHATGQGIKNKVGKFGCIPKTSIQIVDKRFLCTYLGNGSYLIHFGEIEHHIYHPDGSMTPEFKQNVSITLDETEMNKWNDAIQNIDIELLGIGLCDDLQTDSGSSDKYFFTIASLLEGDKVLPGFKTCPPGK